jgi:formylglycine-generating enzyme required for sulfatase activity
MKCYQLLGFLFLSVGFRGQPPAPDMKGQLEMVLDKYAEHWSYFVAQDLDPHATLEVTSNFEALFVPTALIYNQLTTTYLSPLRYAVQIHNFSKGTTLLLQDQQFCRREALFYIYYKQVYNGDCLNCKSKELPALYYRMSVVQSGKGNQWLISKIELSPTQSRLPDEDNDGIPNDCDVCPKTVGTLEYFGDDPYDSCKKGKPVVTPSPKPVSVATPPAPVIPANMVLIKAPPSTYQMGDLFGEGGDDEKNTHSVQLRAFVMDEAETTFAEYDRFCEATSREKPSDAGWGRGKRPVINVSWFDAVAYANWRSVQAGKTPCYTIAGENVRCDWNANGFRLPTEAEWEYAASWNPKTNRKTRFGNGKEIADPVEMNFDGSASYKKEFSVAGEYRGKTLPVKSFAANGQGLYDMAANVWEWCWDWYSSTYSNPTANPVGAATGSHRVFRGGSWQDNPALCRASNRTDRTPSYRGYLIGFRLVFLLQ